MSSRRYKLYLVEDEKTLQEIYSARFSGINSSTGLSNNFEVKVFNNGLELITALSPDISPNSTPEPLPDVILLDIMMPDMNGFETLRSITENFSSQAVKNIPVIVWSNLSNTTDDIMAKNLGAKLYLKKADYSGQDLVDKVRQFLEEKDAKK